MQEPTVVGALVRDARGRVFAQRRTPDRRLLPGLWDTVGGHIEPGETPEDALAREVKEETGWTLRRIEAPLAEWEWQYAGVVHRERDYLVEADGIDGDLTAPQLAPDEHDTYAWIGRDNLELLMAGRDDQDRGLRDLVAKAARVRLTERLRLEPTGPEHAGDLFRLHHDDAVAAWHGTRLSQESALRWATRGRRLWETEGVDKWMAYDRASGELVGRGGLSRAELDGRTLLEISWTVRGDLWSRGYATEMGHAGLAFAFDELREDAVIALTEAHHARSRAVMAKLGMQYVREVVRDGLPSVLYAVNRSAYRR